MEHQFYGLDRCHAGLQAGRHHEPSDRALKAPEHAEPEHGQQQAPAQHAGTRKDEEAHPKASPTPVQAGGATTPTR